MGSTSRGVGLATKPPVFWVVDLSSGEYDKKPLHSEIGSERLGMVIREAADREYIPKDLSEPKRDKTQWLPELPTQTTMEDELIKYDRWRDRE